MENNKNPQEIIELDKFRSEVLLTKNLNRISKKIIKIKMRICIFEILKLIKVRTNFYF